MCIKEKQSFKNSFQSNSQHVSVITVFDPSSLVEVLLTKSQVKKNRNSDELA